MVDLRRQRGLRRRDSILDASVNVVAAQGITALTHRSAAGGAHVSLASVTYHFATADALRKAVFEHAGEAVGQTIARYHPPAPYADLDAVASFYASCGRELLATQRSALTTVFEMFLASRNDKSLSALIDAFTSRLARRLDPITHLRSTSFELVAALEGLTLVALTMPRETSEDWIEGAVHGLITAYGRHVR